MYRIGRQEWERICKEHPEYVCRNINNYRRNGRVSKKGEWSCFEQLLSKDPRHLTNMIRENIDFEIVDEPKMAIKAVTTYWDDGHVDMLVTRIIAGEDVAKEEVNTWHSVSKKSCEEYTDVFSSERDYKEYRNQCREDYKNLFSCTEKFKQGIA
jgi:hypothetical protein